MESYIPSPEQVRERLAPLTYAQMGELSRLSGVPFTTILKIKTSVTVNPGIDTVRKFMSHVEAVC